MTEPYQLTAGDMMLNLILSNSDGHLSLENATSPLYGLVKPHVPLRIVANDGITERVMWQGWIQIIMPSVGQYSERTVEIIAHSPQPFSPPPKPGSPCKRASVLTRSSPN